MIIAMRYLRCAGCRLYQPDGGIVFCIVLVGGGGWLAAGLGLGLG